MRYYLLPLLLLFFGISYGQNRYGQFVVDGGASYNAWRGVHRFPFQDYETSFDFKVGVHATLDWAPVRRISMGAGISTQDQLMRVYDYTWTDGNQTHVEDVAQHIQSFSFSFRGLIHPLKIYEGSGELVDVYFGAQHTLYSMKTSHTSLDPNFPQYSLELRNVPAIVGGVRYMPTEFVGMYVEASLPGTYTVAMGVSFRFAGRDTFFGRR